MNETQTTAPRIGSCHELYPSRLDPDIPLGASHFYQYESEQSWQIASSEHLARLLDGPRPPRYRTVLSMSEADARGLDDGLNEVAYRGPFYIDIDVSPEFGGAAKAIEQMNKCLDKIEDAGVNLRTLRFYASGSKGFHIEMPMEVLLPKVPAGGIQKLPLIYKEMVSHFYVDHVDMRVYTARKGRMWRTPNVQRENGKYKVPVSLDEVRGMTPEVYAELTSAPRAFPRLETPSYISTVGVLFSKAQDKVERLKPAKPARPGALRQRFKGGLPPVVIELCAGRIPIRQEVGWNNIALQIAIVARECGIDADTLAAVAAPLIANHKSDGRYGSTYAREQELRSKVDYVNGRAGYDFSAQGIRSILPEGFRTPDLRGL